eukprot:scaffold95_cov93-Skeletonema_dohrnii-CCMP3373.AAC.3
MPRHDGIALHHNPVTKLVLAAAASKSFKTTSCNSGAGGEKNLQQIKGHKGRFLAGRGLYLQIHQGFHTHILNNITAPTSITTIINQGLSQIAAWIGSRCPGGFPRKANA